MQCLALHYKYKIATANYAVQRMKMSINVLENYQFKFGYLLVTFPFPLVKLKVDTHQVAVSHLMCNKQKSIYVMYCCPIKE